MTTARVTLSGLDLAMHNPLQLSAQPLDDLANPNNGEFASAGAVHEKVINGPIEKVKAAYHRLEYWYHKNVSLTFRRRVIQLQSGLSKGGKLLSTAYNAFDPILSIFRNSVLTGEKILESFKGFTKAVKKTRLFSVFSIPVAVYGVIKSSVGAVSSTYKGKYADAGEHGLNIIDSMGDLSHSVGTFIDGLEVCEVIVGSPALTTATTVLAVVGTAFSVASIALQAKFIYESSKLKNRMIKVFNQEEKADFKGVVNLFDRYKDSRLARHVGVSDGAKLKARMHAIYERNKDYETDSNKKENLTKTIDALKNRIKWNTIGRYVKIVAAVVAIVASIILLCIPGLQVAYALLAVSTAIGIGVLIMDYKMERKLNDHLKGLAPKNSPEMWRFYEKKHISKKLNDDPMLRCWDYTHGQYAKKNGQPIKRQQRSYEFEDARV